MLEFFRKYQRSFLWVIATVVITSFTFFGTYSTFGEDAATKDRSIGKSIEGETIKLSDVQKMARFIARDREDGGGANLCNDGVIRYDFIRDRLADLLVAEYFEPLKEGIGNRLDRAKRFRPYAHPEAPFLSAKTVWDHVAPEINQEMGALQNEQEASPKVFSHLAKLYLLQSRIGPEMLRRILIYQHQQYPNLFPDHRLAHEDLSLFGFHEASDWFGRDFVDLVAQFIINGAAAAEKKGYEVSLKEAKGDLIHHFQESVKKIGSKELHFQNHLRTLGFDERSAAEVWRKVLLFRKFFKDVGDASFVDSMPYRHFSGFANETALVQKYEWPIQIRSNEDLAQLDEYIKTVSAGRKGFFPSDFLSFEAVEKKCPKLVQSKYKGQVAEVTKGEVGLKVPLRQVWEWETEEKNWPLLRKEFSLPQISSREERFQALEKLDPKLRGKVDSFAREKIVDQHPEWIEEALAAAPMKERSWVVSGSEDISLKKEGSFFRVEHLEQVEEKRILLFREAREILAEMIKPQEGICPKDKNPFALAAKEALSALMKSKEDPRWIQSGTSPLADQFKIVRKEEAITRNSKESWMKEEAFLMLPDLWSPIQVADDGQIVFFYLQEKKVDPAPILDHLSFGKETLAADAKAFVAEKLIELAKNKKAIVIPVQNEDEE